MIRPVFFALLAAATSSCSRSNETIECPTPESGQAAGTLQETPAQIDAAGAQLGRGNENEIAGAAAAIRARHPTADKAAIINYLVTAYCPRINGRPGLTRAAKRQALTDFSARANRIVR
jgi:hypothetical protein